jgi:hypothetical protein
MINTKVSPAWFFRILIFATLVLGIVFQFGSPVVADRLLANPYNPLGKHTGAFIERHKNIVAGAAEIARGLGEALIIASILGLLVDPYVKFRLIKEVGPEIAREAVGEHLPAELRQQLERIQDIDLYQLNMVINITLDQVDALPGYMKWQTAMRHEVKNVSWNKHPFEHRFSISDSAAERHDGRIIAVSHSVDDKVQYSLTDPSVELNSMLTRVDSTTFFKHPDARKIASTRVGPTHKYEYACTTERFVPHSEIQVIQVLFPTVGIDLTVHHPPKVAIHTSLQYVDGIEPKTPEGETPGQCTRWQCGRAYLPNEHIWIMYEVDDGKTDQAQATGNSASQATPAATG